MEIENFEIKENLKQLLLNNINNQEVKIVSQPVISESGISSIYINSICNKLSTIKPDIMTSKVNDMMSEETSVPGFCITENEKVVGVITRNHLYTKLSGLYGYCLYSKEPISDIMYKEFLTVDYKTPIDVVSKMAMGRKHDNLYDFITVTKEGKYYGVVTVKNLLEKTMEIEVFNAKHSNPLSGLPGNIPIEQNLNKCIDSKKSYCVLYLDIDNFKAYNDVYGFENGDVVIKSLADIIKKNIPSDEFVGHIGGDDFISILHKKLFNKDCIKKLCKNIIIEFDKAVLGFYSEKDIDKGFIVTKNRYGIEEEFPLLSISIAGVTKSDVKNIYELAERASELKKVCKQNVGSIFMVV